jgi:hypothetical protein
VCEKLSTVVSSSSRQNQEEKLDLTTRRRKEQREKEHFYEFIANVCMSSHLSQQQFTVVEETSECMHTREKKPSLSAPLFIPHENFS